MLMTPLKQRLLEDLQKRNLRITLPHFFILLLIYLILRGKSPLYPYVILLSSLFLKLYLMKKYFEEIKIQDFIITSFYLSAVALTGIGWGVLFWEVHRVYGLFSIETLSCLGITMTLMSGGVTALSSSVKFAVVHLVSFTVIPAVVLLNDSTPSSYLLSVLFGVNLFCQLYNVFISSEYLRHSVENELLAVHEKETLQEFIDAIPGLVMVIDKNKNFIMINSHQGGAYEYLLGQTIESYLPESEVTKILVNFYHSSETESIAEAKVGDAGEENWYIVNLRRISSAEACIIAVIYPITELVKAKNELRIQEARSQYAVKLASLGELSAGIAHEVNNPLTIIEGAANLMKVLLKESPLDVASLEKASSKVMETTQRIARIVKSLRTLSGNAEEEPFTNVSFHSIVEPCIEISRAKLDGLNIKLKVCPSEKDVALFGNEVQLSQVLMNLVSNAIDAVKLVDGPRWIEIHYRPSYEWLDILVVDSGEGVGEDIQQKIMEPFFTTKDSSNGTGLGLSISKSIVHSHHGSLTLVPEQPHTTFRIRLPRMNPWLNLKKKNQEEDTDAVLG